MENNTQLRSLITSSLMTTEGDLKDLQSRLSLPDRLIYSRNVRKRLLSREANSFLRYLLGVQPPISLVKRYINAVQQLKAGEPLALPVIFCKFPSLLGSINGPAIKHNNWAKEFNFRLDLATAIAEASPIGAATFLKTCKPQSFFNSAIIVCIVAANELGQRIFGLFITPILNASLRKSDTPND